MAVTMSRSKVWYQRLKKLPKVRAGRAAPSRTAVAVYGSASVRRGCEAWFAASQGTSSQPKYRGRINRVSSPVRRLRVRLTATLSEGSLPARNSANNFTNRA